MGEKIKILDHGSIELVEHWGSDESIITSARMSTDKGFQGWGPMTCRTCKGHGHIATKRLMDDGWGEVEECPTCKGNCAVPGDEKLLRYLWEHKHLSPFEMAGAIFEVQAPIFVFREWHRHRTQSYNELSARYTPIPDVNYRPTVERLLTKPNANKQAQGTGATLTEEQAIGFQAALERQYAEAQETYTIALQAGVPKELARLVIPVGRYSRMRASANLRNWLSFLTLRNDPAAQWEIQVYAQAVQDILRERFPRTLALFEESHAPDNR